MNKEFIYSLAITRLCLNTRQCILSAWHQMKRKGLLFCWPSPSNMQEGITYLKCTCCNFHVESVQYTTSCTLISFKKIAWLLTQHILASYSPTSHSFTLPLSWLHSPFPPIPHTLTPTYTHTPHPHPHSHPHSYPYMPTHTHRHTHTPSPLHTHTHTHTHTHGTRLVYTSQPSLDYVPLVRVSLCCSREETLFLSGWTRGSSGSTPVGPQHDRSLVLGSGGREIDNISKRISIQGDACSE